jgi:hypothetical protein
MDRNGGLLCGHDFRRTNAAVPLKPHSGQDGGRHLSIFCSNGATASLKHILPALRIVVRALTSAALRPHCMTDPRHPENADYKATSAASVLRPH